jgi:hypothetical protein
MKILHPYTIACDNGFRTIHAESEDDAYAIALLSGWIKNHVPEQWAIEIARNFFKTAADTPDLDLMAHGLDADAAAQVYRALDYLHSLEKESVDDEGHED